MKPFKTGYEPVRRLTNQEYNHTIRDLFGTHMTRDRFRVI